MQRHANRDLLLSTLFSLRTYLYACVHFWTHVGALALRYEIREASPNGLVSGTSLPHSPARRWYCALSPGTTCVSFRPCALLLRLHSRSFSPFRLLLVGPKRRRWRLITTQSPLPVRLGLRPVPRKQQPPFAALGHSPPRYRCCKTNNLRPVPWKKEHSPPRAPFPAPFRQITGGPTDHPTTGIRGIHRENSRDSTLAVPIERRGRHVLNPRRQLLRRHDTARNANGWKEVYFGIIPLDEWWTFRSEMRFESTLSRVMRVHRKDKMRHLLK